MKFIYLDAEGNRIGPVDESVIDRGIRDGSITADTAISNAMLQDFCTVAQMDCFAEALKDAPGAAEAAAAAAEAERNLPLWVRLKRASEDAGKRAVTLRGELQGKDAPFSRRFMAMLTDGLLLLILAAFLLAPGVTEMREKGEWVDYAETEERAVQKAKAEGTAVITAEDTAPLELPEKYRKQEPLYSPAPSNSVHNTPGARAARMIAPGAMRRLDNAVSGHHQAVEEAASDTAPSNRRNSTASARTQSAPAEIPAQETAEAAAAEEESKPLFARILPEKLPAITFYTARKADDGRLMIRQNDKQVVMISEEDYYDCFSGRVAWFLFFMLVYYSVSLGVFAQTAGMWFWGIMLTRTKGEEVYYVRALLYAIALPIFGILMIPMVLICKRSLADLICGVRQISVASGR